MLVFVFYVYVFVNEISISKHIRFQDVCVYVYVNMCVCVCEYVCLFELVYIVVYSPMRDTDQSLIINSHINNNSS